jgi:hypothetical protein
MTLFGSTTILFELILIKSASCVHEFACRVGVALSICHESVSKKKDPSSVKAILTVIHFINLMIDRGMCCSFNMKAAEEIFVGNSYWKLIKDLQKKDQGGVAIEIYQMLIQYFSKTGEGGQHKAQEGNFSAFK